MDDRVFVEKVEKTTTRELVYCDNKFHVIEETRVQPPIATVVSYLTYKNDGYTSCVDNLEQAKRLGSMLSD